MAKYLAVFKVGLLNAFAYRFTIVFFLVMHFLALAVIFFLWLAIFNSPGQAEIAGYSLASIVTYYLGASIVRQAIASHFEYQMASEILRGKLSIYLLKPFSYLFCQMIRSWTWQLLSLILSLALYLAAIILLRDYIIVPSLVQAALFLLALIPGAIIYALVSAIFGTLTFWLLDPNNLFGLKETIIVFLSGFLLPLAFFPPVLQDVFFYLPFRYLISFPVEIFLGRLSGTAIWQGFLVELAWIPLLAIFLSWFWQKGVRHYEAVGS